MRSAINLAILMMTILDYFRGTNQTQAVEEEKIDEEKLPVEVKNSTSLLGDEGNQLRMFKSL